MATRKNIEYWFPNIIGKPFKIFESNFNFNCVAYTLDIYDDYMWTNEKCWPYQAVPRIASIENFKKLYEFYGYEECFNNLYEVNYEKIAFYAKDDIPLHAAKQFKNTWKSKISNLIIEHELDWLCGDTEDAYGDVVFIMKISK